MPYGLAWCIFKRKMPFSLNHPCNKTLPSQKANIFSVCVCVGAGRLLWMLFNVYSIFQTNKHFDCRWSNIIPRHSSENKNATDEKKAVRQMSSQSRSSTLLCCNRSHMARTQRNCLPFRVPLECAHLQHCLGSFTILYSASCISSEDNLMRNMLDEKSNGDRFKYALV